MSWYTFLWAGLRMDPSSCCRYIRKPSLVMCFFCFAVKMDGGQTHRMRTPIWTRLVEKIKLCEVPDWVNSTCSIHLIFLNQLVSIFQSHLLPLLIQQEAQQVSVAHLTSRFSIFPKNHFYFLALRQQVVEVFDLWAFQGTWIWCVTFLANKIGNQSAMNLISYYFFVRLCSLNEDVSPEDLSKRDLP